ncbi:hypothetical protein GCM10010295_16800 [Streptomyces intermedius]
MDGTPASVPGWRRGFPGGWAGRGLAAPGRPGAASGWPQAPAGLGRWCFLSGFTCRSKIGLKRRPGWMWHPRAAAPGRDPQPVRHRSPEQPPAGGCAVPWAGLGEPEQSGQRVPGPRSTLLCGEGGGFCVAIVD